MLTPQQLLDLPIDTVLYYKEGGTTLPKDYILQVKVIENNSTALEIELLVEILAVIKSSVLYPFSEPPIGNRLKLNRPYEKTNWDWTFWRLEY